MILDFFKTGSIPSTNKIQRRRIKTFVEDIKKSRTRYFKSPRAGEKAVCKFELKQGKVFYSLHQYIPIKKRYVKILDNNIKRKIARGQGVVEYAGALTVATILVVTTMMLLNPDMMASFFGGVIEGVQNFMIGLIEE